MKSRTILLALLSIIPVVSECQMLAFRDRTLSMEQRIESLLSQLTLDEKINQMMHLTPEIERLGIPAYSWANEALHGIGFTDYPVTVFPQVIGCAAAFDRESIRKMGDMISTEGRAIYNSSRAKGQNGYNYVGITYWTPNVNIFRDPRWGRGQETYGEDPFLSGELGKAMVSGLQGDDTVYLKTSACAKHYAVHSGPESIRNSFDVKVDDYDLWNTYLPAFRELVIDGRVSSVMGAYNRYDGTPCCANKMLMRDVLYGSWNFKGYVVSDCNAIEDIHARHKYTLDAAEAAAEAVKAGTTLECGEQYKALGEAIKRGLITEKDIDNAMRRLMLIRFRLGMFDETTEYDNIDEKTLESKPHYNFATELARKSIVLLENKNNILPLSEVRKVAVIGPNANQKEVLWGNYHGKPSQTVTIYEGIRKEAARRGIDVVYDKACSVTDNFMIKEIDFMSLIKDAGTEGFEVTYYDNIDFNGDPRKMEHISKFPDFVYGDQTANVVPGVPYYNIGIRYESKFKADTTCDLSFNVFADDGMIIYIDGKPLGDLIRFRGRYVLPVEEGRTYDIRMDYVQYIGGGRIEMSAGTVTYGNPDRTNQIVKDCDAVIFVGGINTTIESEGTDRTSYYLPPVQQDQLKALKDRGKKVVLVLLSGSAIGLESEASYLDAIVHAWYPGQNGGTAVADVLFGNYNPAGRLPVTFYNSERDLGEMTDYRMDNRTYRYFNNPVLFPFGYGLSYTDFEYTELNVENRKRCGDNIDVEVTVRNKGTKDGDEVVQIYVKNPNMRENVTLKEFKRVHIKAGETAKVKFTLTPKAFATCDDEGNVAEIPTKITLIASDRAPVNPINGNTLSKQIKVMGVPYEIYNR